MRDRQALLEAVLAAPDDPAPRLVLADALLEAGDPRGELIAVEHRLESEPATALLDRRRELRRLHGATWWPETPTRFVRSRWGFAQAVAFRPETVAGAAAIAAREPLRTIEVFAGAPEPAEVAALPRVPELVLHAATNEMVEALLETPLASSLASLDLSGSQVFSFEPRGRLPACRRLRVAATQVEVVDLMRWEHLGQVRELDLSGTETGPRDLAVLLGLTPELAVLRASSLELGRLDDRESLAMLVAALAALPLLARVELVGCDLSEAELAALRQARPQLAIETEPGGGTVALDLVGSALELAPDGERGWRVVVDGLPRSLRCEFLQSDSVGSVRRPGAEGEHAALGLLVDALARGFPRKLTDEGFELQARMLPHDNNVEASVTVPDEPHPVSIDLEHFVD